MRPVAFWVLGIPVQSYGLSKVAAALVAAWLLGRAFERHGLPRADAHALVLVTTVWGFVGAKVYYLAGHPDSWSWHGLGTGFTWYGGFAAGLAVALVTIRRRGLPLGLVAGSSAAPLSVAYGIGRLGCLLAGDGTYGRPSSLPWAMAFPDGAVPTTVRVEPTPLYEAVLAFALAGLLWWLGRRCSPPTVFAAYLIGSGAARFWVEFLRVNPRIALGLTGSQLWAALAGLSGLALVILARRRPARSSVAVAPRAGSDIVA